MSNLTTYKKPELAVISELKKLREYSNTDRLTIAKNIVEGLLNRLGVGHKSNELHHIEAIKFIADNKEFTPDEFSKAFDLAIEGILKIDILQQLNCVVIGRVMALYKAYKIENLKNYYRQREQLKNTSKELTKDQKKQLISDAIKDEFTNYKFSGELNENRNYLYDELNIEVADKFKKVAWKHSVKEIREEQKELSKRNKVDNETLKAKCIIRYKRKLVALIFDKFTTYEQLKSKLI